MNDLYILEGRKVVKADIETWMATIGETNQIVAKTKINDSEVSTVFLGLDHQSGDGPPLLFETLVFGGDLNREVARCTTWEEAEAMHEAMCERVRSNNKEQEKT